MSSVNFGPVSSSYSQPSGAVAFKGKPAIKQIVNSTKLNNIEKSILNKLFNIEISIQTKLFNIEKSIQNKLSNINMPQIIYKAIDKFLKFVLKKHRIN